MFLEFLRNYGPKTAKIKLNDECVNICYLIWCTIVATLSFIGKCCMFVTLFVLFIAMVYSMVVAPALSICHYFIPNLFIFRNEDDATLGVVALIVYAIGSMIYLIVKGAKYISVTHTFNKLKNRFCIKIKIK